MTVHEAQILGKPVVISRFPTSGSQLYNEDDGLIVPKGNQDRAQEISQLIQNPDYQLKLATEVKRRKDCPDKQLEQIDAILQ